MKGCRGRARGIRWASRFSDHTHEAAAVLPLTDDRKVDARALHGWLGIGAAFNVWMLRLLRDYGFEEGQDFRSTLNKSTGGRPRKDYLLTLDAAKEIAMIGNTARGKATRRYFIAAEKAAMQIARGEGEASAQRYLQLVRTIGQRTAAPVRYT